MSAAYQVRVTARAGRDLYRLPQKIAAACIEFIAGPLADNPRGLGKPLHAELAGLHSARRGDYRVIYEIDDDQGALVIEHIDRRSDVYR